MFFLPFPVEVMLMAVAMSVPMFAVRMWLDGVRNQMKESITEQPTGCKGQQGL